MNMRKIVSVVFILYVVLHLFAFKSVAEDNSGEVEKVVKNSKQNEINVFTGMFDFSDEKQKAGLFGFQHQSDELFRESFLGKLSPITGGFLTENNAMYLYTGVQAEYEMGPLTITPSFAPGLYERGDGKDLGHAIEFRSGLDLAYRRKNGARIGAEVHHLSNASLDENNPGTETFLFTYSIPLN